MINYFFKTSIFIILFFTGCLSTISNLKIKTDMKPEDAIEKIDQWLENLSLKKKFNGAILVAINGKTVLMKTYGFSDFERTKQLTSKSSFRLASVSKQFTAMAIMILKEQGKLHFDDPVKNYLNKFPYADVTIRHFLTHTSGVPDYENLVLQLDNKSSTKYFYRTGQSKENITYEGEPSLYKEHHYILSMEDVLKLVIENREKRKFMAGEKFKYSNTGYVLLALIVEKISGQTFESFMDQEIFIPLSMKNSSVWNLNTMVGKLEDRVQGTNNNNLNDFTWMDGVAGDGAVFMCIEDFIKWDRSLANYNVVSDTTFQEAVTPFVTSTGDTSYYGFGWSLSENSSDMDHAGEWVGALTYIYRNPENGLLFVLLDSSTNQHMGKIRKSILKSLKNIY